MNSIETKRKYANIIIAIGINIGLMLLFLLLFEPTAKSDDFDMMNVLYGGYNGELSPFILYSNPIYGYFLCFLIKIVPSVPWYFIVQYVLMLWAIIEITIIILNKTRIPIWLLLPLLSFIYYECFIRITFSKTSGVLIICGFLIVYYLIDTLKRPSVRLVEGIVLILIGNLIRSGIFLMLLEIFAGGFVLFVILNIQHFDKHILISIITFVVVSVALYLSVNILSTIGNKMYNNDDVWGNYLNTNSKRAALFDYGIPDFDTYQKEYEEIGVSYEDYQMWFVANNRDDPDLLSTETINKIRSIANHSTQVNTIDKIRNAFRNLINWCFNNTMFYLFIICSLLLLISQRKKALLIFTVILLTCLIAYFYLYILGRTQHHIDAIIFVAGSFLVLYFCDFKDGLKKKETILVTTLMGFCFISSFYNELKSSSYYGTVYGSIVSQREQYTENKSQLDLLVEDSEHLYLSDPNDTNTIYPAFTVYEIISKNYYHNLHRLNMDHIPVHKAVLADYDVINPIREIVNSDILYYYVSFYWQNDAYIFWDYIKDNYDKDVQMEAVKSTNQGIVFRYYTEDYKIKEGGLSNIDKLDYNIKSMINEQKKELTISGYVFEKGTDSFAQNVYIKLNERYYMSNQSENPKYDNKYEGKYSRFIKTIDYSDLETMDDTLLFVVLENTAGIYEIPIELSLD